MKFHEPSHTLEICYAPKGPKREVHYSEDSVAKLWFTFDRVRRNEWWDSVIEFLDEGRVTGRIVCVECDHKNVYIVDSDIDVLDGTLIRDSRFWKDLKDYLECLLKEFEGGQDAKV